MHDITDVAHRCRNHRGIANVTPDVFDRRMLGASGNSNVQRADRETLRQQVAAQLGAQESGTTGDEC